ncbi:MAG: TonB-dependent receptor plug domain-containing protein, partial [Cohaesibacter sp.]|nr:TonB-dependent receptor plug domain-containing protein [Cohaesibacter sp.]
MAKGRESGTRKASYLCGIAALALTVAAPAATYAQEAEELDTIYVKSNYNKDRFAEAADRNFSTYISEKAIKEAQSGDLKDLFAEEASITVGGGIPIAQKIFVNGVDMLNLNVTIDGAMQNNRSFHHVTANAIDPGLLKAVRVDAGIAAADSGPNATAGSVAFQTKDALDFLKGDDKFGGRTLFSADSNSLTFSEAL